MLNALHLAERDAFIRWHEIGGEGPPVLCLAGLGCPAVSTFLGLAMRPPLAGRRMLMVDLLGAGASDAAEAPLDLDAHADGVAAVLDHLGVGACVLLGYSMGGTVGIALALRRPDLVSRLLLGEANVLPGGGAASRRIAAVSREAFLATGWPELRARLRRKALAGDAQAAFFLGAWTQADPAALHADAAALVDLPERFAAAFLGLSLPRVFFYGARSAAPAPDAPDPALLAAHGVSTVVVPDCGHELMIGNPKGFAAALVEHLPPV